MIDLHYVDELIAVRQAQHGGGRGAPRVVAGGVRIGASINRSCIVMLSALLQGHVDEVFERCAPVAFPEFSRSGAPYAAFLDQSRRLGNPHSNNIINLFRRIGIHDVMAGLTWRRRRHTISYATITAALDEINQIRNRISHGQPLTLNGQPYQLKLARVKALRNIVEGFGEHFDGHAQGKLAASRL